jgi:hypothetical protein
MSPSSFPPPLEAANDQTAFSNALLEFPHWIVICWHPRINRILILAAPQFFRKFSALPWARATVTDLSAKEKGAGDKHPGFFS